MASISTYPDQEHHAKEDAYLKSINEFAVEMNKQNSLQELLFCIISSTINILQLEDCVIYIANQEKKELYQFDAFGPKKLDAGEIYNPIILQFGEGIVGAAAKEKKYQLIGNTSSDNRYVVDDQNRLSELAVPIIHNEEVVGVIDSESSEINYYKDHHLNVFQTIAQLIPARLHDLRSQEELKITIEKLKNEGLKNKLALEIGNIVAIEFTAETEQDSLTANDLEFNEDPLLLGCFKQYVKTYYRAAFSNNIDLLQEGKQESFAAELILTGLGNYNETWVNVHLMVLQRFTSLKPKKVILMIRDISETKYLEKLAMEVEENERIKFSKLIHDTVSTNLSATRFLFQQNPDSSEKWFNEMDEILSESLKNSRDIMKRLSIQSTDKELKTVIDEIIESQKAVFPGEIDLKWSGAYQIGETNISINILRILEEILDNAVKYSKADFINVEVKINENILLSISDDGVGFNVDEMTSENYFGLYNITERAKNIGGSISIQSEIGKGTKVEFAL